MCESQCKFRGFAVTLKALHKTSPVWWNTLKMISQILYRKVSPCSMLCSLWTIPNPLLQDEAEKEGQKICSWTLTTKSGMFFTLWRLKGGENAPSAQQDTVTDDSARPFNTEALCHRLPETHHHMGRGQDWEGSALTWSEKLTAAEQSQW